INFFTPKDRASRCVARRIAYGPDRRQVLDIYAPRHGTGPWPVIYFVYGGSWNVGEPTYYSFAGRALAALGYVVVVIDYRLIPQVEYPAFLEDCAAGLQWTVENIARYGGDPRRIALMGHSAGAYNAVMLLLADRPLPRDSFAGRIRAFVG